MNLPKSLTCIALLTLTIPVAYSCASAINLPTTDQSSVLTASNEGAPYVSEILKISDTKTESGDAPAKQEPVTVLPYVCPMHPEVQSNKPGKCPKCGMKLKLREGEVKNHEHH